MHSVFDAVTVDFVTPIDREDIISLTQKLDDVLDYMEGTVQRFYMLDVKEMHPKAGEFAELLLKSCEKLGKALEDFDEFKNSKKINKLIIDVGSVEEEADELFFHTLRELYSHGEENPLYVFVWDKLFPAPREHSRRLRAGCRYHGHHHHEELLVSLFSERRIRSILKSLWPPPEAFVAFKPVKCSERLTGLKCAFPSRARAQLVVGG